MGELQQSVYNKSLNNENVEKPKTEGDPSWSKYTPAMLRAPKSKSLLSGHKGSYIIFNVVIIKLNNSIIFIR